MNRLAALTGRFQSLQSREKLIVLIGAMLVILTVLWAVFDPLLTRRSELQQQHQALLADLGWMQEQGELLARLQNRCGQIRIIPSSPREFISRQASRNGLQLASLQERTESRFSLQLSGGDGNAVLRLAYQMLCQGFDVTSLEIEHQESGAINAALEVTHGS